MSGAGDPIGRLLGRYHHQHSQALLILKIRAGTEDVAEERNVDVQVLGQHLQAGQCSEIHHPICGLGTVLYGNLS